MRWARRIALLGLGALAYPLGVLAGHWLHHHNTEATDPTNLDTQEW